MIPQLGNFLEAHIPHMANPHHIAARDDIYEWYTKFPIYENEKHRAAFLQQSRFDVMAALSFPHATEFQLGACLIFYLWSFVVDDIADEGVCQEDTEAFVRLTKICMEVLNDTEGTMKRSNDPYVEMLQDLLARMRTTGSEGMLRRFTQGFNDWSSSQITQSQQRSNGELPRVRKFLTERRNTFGIGMACALIEYTMDIDLPDFIFKDPTVVEMTEAMFDVTIWANDLCSFNKEQAQGDYQNLIPILMQEYRLDLQSAISKLTEMVRQRLDRYYHLKAQLHPIYGGLEISGELVRYLEGLEVANVGVTKWYYQSPRYFRDVDASQGSFVEVELFEHR